MTNLDADPETLELLDDPVAKGLVESTGNVLRRPGPLVRLSHGQGLGAIQRGARKEVSRKSHARALPDAVPSGEN